MKKFILSAATAAAALTTLSADQFYVIMKDGSVESYPTEKVDSISFNDPQIAKIMGFNEMAAELVKLKARVAALEAKSGTVDTSATVNASDLKYFVINDKEVEVEGLINGSADVIIPETALVNGKIYTVTSIAQEAFKNQNRIQTVSLPKTLKNIENSAFYGCSSLTSIEIPSGVTSIGSRAFEGCKNLDIVIDNSRSNVECENGVIGVKSLTFTGSPFLFKVMADGGVAVVRSEKGGDYDEIYRQMKSITIPTEAEINGKKYSVTAIGNNAFAYCSNLTSVEIPSSVTSIGNSAFSGCMELDVVIDNSRSNVECDYAFRSVKSVKFTGSELNFRVDEERNEAELVGSYLRDDYNNDYNSIEKLSMPSEVEIKGKKYTVTSIGSDAFNGCSGLTSIEIPSSVTSIGYSAFNGCSGLTSIEIPSSVTSIGSDAFNGCSGLTSIEIPSSVTSIGLDAFYGCENLDVVIDNSRYNVDCMFAFRGVKSVKFTGSELNFRVDEADGTAAFDGSFLYEDWLAYMDMEKIVIPSEVEIRGKKYPVTAIEERALRADSVLQSVEIPASINRIDSWSFLNCYGLTDITVSPENPNYSSLDGVLYNKDKTVLLCIPNGKEGEVKIPSSVTESEGAYGAWDKIDLVVDNSRMNAFYLEHLELLHRARSVTFTGSPLYFDFNPDNGTAMVVRDRYSSEKIFRDLDSIVIPSEIEFKGKTYTVTGIGQEAFYGDEFMNLSRVEIPSTVTIVESYSFSPNENLEIIIDNSRENVKIGDLDYVKSVTFLKE